MGHTSKTLALLLTVIIAMSCLTLLTVKPADAQTIPNPPPPQFTASFIRTFYTVTAPDPVTGENVTQQFQNNTINVKIDNILPYSSLLSEGKYHLYYNIRIKNSGNDWSELYPPEPFYNNATDFNSTALNLARTPKASASQFTTLSFYDYYPSYPPNTLIEFVPPFHFPPGTQLDIAVQAIFGVDSQVYLADHPTAPWLGGHYEPAVVEGAMSDWSAVQTVNIPVNSSSPTPSQTLPSPTHHSGLPPQNPSPVTVAIAAVAAAAVLAVIVLFLKTRMRPKNASHKQ